MTGIDVTLADEEQKPQTLLYLVDGLADNGKQHNVILTKLPGPAARPFFFDYAVVSSRQECVLFISPVKNLGSDCLRLSLAF